LLSRAFLLILVYLLLKQRKLT